MGPSARSAGWLPIAGSIAVLMAAATAGPVRADATYTYSDDFSGSQAETDSYFHSPIVEELPDIHLSGVLMYGNSPSGSRALGFHHGWEVEGAAFLHYRFPIGEATMAVQSGELRFEVWPDWECPGGIFVTVSYDGSPGGFTHGLDAAGTYQYPLSPALPCDGVFVHFAGDGVFLDNLRVSLDTETPVEGRTWGAVKALFR